MKKFTEYNLEERERKVQDHIRLLHEDGISAEFDGKNCARVLSKWAATLLKDGEQFPPSPAEWLSDGLVSAFKGKSLEKSLGLKRTKRGAKEKRDKHLEVKVAVAKLVVSEGITVEKAMALLEEHIVDPLSKGEWLFEHIKAGCFSGKSSEALTYDGIKKIIYNKKDPDIAMIIEDIKAV